MLKKITLVLLPTIAAGLTVVALALPSGAPANTFYKCPAGITDHAYCHKYKRCVVPRLIGKTVRKARHLLRRHDCRLGKVHRRTVAQDHRAHRVKVGRIYRQHPRAHRRFHKRKRVNVWVHKR